MSNNNKKKQPDVTIKFFSIKLIRCVYRHLVLRTYFSHELSLREHGQVPEATENGPFRVDKEYVYLPSVPGHWSIRLRGNVRGIVSHQHSHPCLHALQPEVKCQCFSFQYSDCVKCNICIVLYSLVVLPVFCRLLSLKV